MRKRIICIVTALSIFPLLIGCNRTDKEIKVVHEIHTESNENRKENENHQVNYVVDNRDNPSQIVYVQKNYDYIIPDSNIRYLSRAELSGYSIDELSYIRNEIFARHGYVFSMAKYANYFSSKSWYVPNYSYNGNYSVLNNIEVSNIELLRDMEGI